MLNSNTRSEICKHLMQYGVFCRDFAPIQNLSHEEGYPSYLISAKWGDMDIKLKLVACVHDASTNIFGIKITPDKSNRDEKVFFSITVLREYDRFVHKYMHKNGFYDDLSFIYAINNKLPMKTNYSITVGPDILFLMTGHFVYTPTGYVIIDHSKRPVVHLSTSISLFNGFDMYRHEKDIMKLHHDGINIFPVNPCEDIKNREDIKLKLFQSFILHYMQKTQFQIDDMSIDDILSLSYDDLMRVVTLQKMVDI